MSEPSSYNTFDSEEESSGWLMTSESTIDDDEDDLSDELTLLNADENSDEESSVDDEFIRLSQRLKEKYNLQEATVGLERCDKIWDTMQLLKKVQKDYGVDEDESCEVPSGSAASAVPYIKYQPVQGNGNNALPNFYLAVKSQRKVYHCVTCGRQYGEKRSLRQHSAKAHGIVLPQKRIKARTNTETRNLRPRTPCELGSGGARDSVADDKIVNNSSKQISTDTEDSVGETIVGGAKRTDSAELNQLLGIVLDCPLCPATLTNRKRLYKHCFDFHSMSVKQTRKLMDRKSASSKKSTATGRVSPVATSSSESLSEASKSGMNMPSSRRGRRMHTIDGVKARWQFSCKACNKSFFERRSIRSHAWTQHNYSMPSYKAGGLLAALRNSDLFKAELVKSVEPASKIVASKKGPRRSRWRFYCKSCKKWFVKGTSLRSHARKYHNYNMPPFKAGGLLAAVQNSDLFGAELVKVGDPPPSMSSLHSDASIRGKNNFSNKRNGAERPRRACALRTSYTECTKEEEEELQKTLAGISNSPPKSSPPKTPPGQTTTCFLCKKSFVDMRKHLVDYHRINSPESILPLKPIAEPVEPKNGVSSESPPDGPPKSKVEAITKSRQAVWAAIEAGEDPRINVVRGANRKKAYQCAVCLYKYKHISTVVKHLKANTVNGVLQDHAIYVRYNNKRPEEKDPLALTDNSDASKSNSTFNTSEDDDSSSAGRKRMTSSSDDRQTPSPEPKRRKIEESETDAEAVGSEARSDCVEDNAEVESVIELSESDSRSVEEVKYPNDREARDSSDRDSGIGISITIKKRNDSYEVVGREDSKTKESESSKDDNDSSSDFAPVDDVSRDRDTDRPCEIVNSIDCSKDEDVLGPVRTDGDGVENESGTEDRRTSAVADEIFRWKDGRCREEACDSARGFIRRRET